MENSNIFLDLKRIRQNWESYANKSPASTAVIPSNTSIETIPEKFADYFLLLEKEFQTLADNETLAFFMSLINAEFKQGLNPKNEEVILSLLDQLEDLLDTIVFWDSTPSCPAKK